MKSCPTCKSTYPQDFAVCPRDATPLEEVGAWSEGTVIRGKYRVLAKVGEGGMGAVYKALHLRFNELRALKVISAVLASDSNFVKRFEKEAVLTRRLEHPNAVRVDDIDEAEDGRPFIVMEYIEGWNLKRVIQQEGTLPVPRVVAIIRQVASALGAAHALGMIHRDIKPENIVLVQTPRGEQAKVLDFGIARIREARAGQIGGPTLTETGVIIGSPPYMSPEQAMGMKSDQLDARSDLYSLGVVMYQMLTGTLPLKADTTMSMLMAHIQTPPIPIRQARPDLPISDSVATLVMSLLGKKPESRPPSAGALADALENIERDSSGWPAGTVAVRPSAAIVTGAPRDASSATPSLLPGPPAVEPALLPTHQSTPPVSAAVPRTSPRLLSWQVWALVGILLILLAGLVWGAYLYGRKRAFEEAHALGHDLMQKHDLEGAIREYRKALKLRPDLDHVRLDLALALEAKGERRAAVEEFEVVCKRNPDLPECRKDYERLLKQLKEGMPRR